MRRSPPTPSRVAAAVAVLVALVVLWLVRPLWHGFAWFFWASPLVWVPPVLVLVAGTVALRRSTRWRTLEDLESGRRPDPRLVAFPIVAFVLLVGGSAFNGALTARSLASHTDFTSIPQLPAGGLVRLVPREVAEQSAAGAFNSSTETLTDLRIVRTEDGLKWTALRTPQGLFRTFSKKSQGLVVLDAQQTARNLQQVDQPLDVAPGLQITDNLRWRLLKRHFLVDLQDPVGIQTPDGVRIMVPYVESKGFLIRRPVLGGVFVVAPDGRIEDLSPAQAAARPELAQTGRIYPDALARRVQDSYAYRKGIFNKLFVHEDQTQITDTAINAQPYLIDFAGTGGLGPQWVTVAEPYGRAFAAKAIFLTDATTGKVRIWEVPKGKSYSGNARALDAVRAISIPGIDFGQGPGGTGNFRVVEPRPVFVRGRLVYLTSIIPLNGSSVAKTVVTDAETNKLVQVFSTTRTATRRRRPRPTSRRAACPTGRSPTGRRTTRRRPGSARRGRRAPAAAPGRPVRRARRGAPAPRARAAPWTASSTGSWPASGSSCATRRRCRRRSAASARAAAADAGGYAAEAVRVPPGTSSARGISRHGTPPMTSWTLAPGLRSPPGTGASGSGLGSPMSRQPTRAAWRRTHFSASGRE